MLALFVSTPSDNVLQKAMMSAAPGVVELLVENLASLFLGCLCHDRLEPQLRKLRIGEEAAV
eukprot:CAMPEP_0179032494 /NCGR_PEP_ID=MMETSP0796-20121207/11616_1 /TAXON_ID=73915 /ORGANISM="Pyrodinium bahamense, Strain pbaha01" /LENGTH=61 /DNA_ID=CAMNT_0020728721 /DNA_START=298 /DNA_END=480 /DNA_ORIENTATION=+